MKKYGWLALVALFTMTFGLSAQNQRGHRGEGRHEKGMEKITAEMRADKMAKELNLTADEKSKVLQLFTQQDEKMKAFREEQKKVMKARQAEMKERMAKFDAERKAQDAELQKIIGKDKFAQLQELRIERLEKMNRMQKMKEFRKMKGEPRHEGPGQEAPKPE